MLQRFIEYRERAHHAQDSNRRSLPFEWGLEHLNLPPAADPELSLEQYARGALANSDSFYAYEPTSQYDFDGHVLRFPSYIETP